MDSKTIEAYSSLASDYSQDWLSQPEPKDMYDLIQKFFISKGQTAEVGCGNGRDASWLSLNGYKVYGFDSSIELIKLAHQLFPNVQFQQAILPKLSEINEQFDNVLCETVIMHLPKNEIVEAIQNLKRILKKGGILYLSWRVTEEKDMRHKDGRLYSAFSSDFILNQFAKESILHFEDVTSASSGKRVCRLVYKM